MFLPGQHLPGRADPDPVGVGTHVRHPDQEPVAAGAPGAEGVLLLHHGGHQQAASQVAAKDTVEYFELRPNKLKKWLKSKSHYKF